MKYNEEHGITPTQVVNSNKSALGDGGKGGNAYYQGEDGVEVAAETAVEYMDIPAVKAAIKQAKDNMLKASKNQDFIDAALFRDEMFLYEAKLAELRADKK